MKIHSFLKLITCHLKLREIGFMIYHSPFDTFSTPIERYIHIFFYPGRDLKTTHKISNKQTNKKSKTKIHKH